MCYKASDAVESCGIIAGAKELTSIAIGQYVGHAGAGDTRISIRSVYEVYAKLQRRCACLVVRTKHSEMGLLKKGVEIEKTPSLQSVLTQAILDELEAGRLPTIQTDSIELSADEQCHYVDRAIYEKKLKVPRGRKEGKAGIFRGRETRMDRERDTIVDIAFEQIAGYLYITTQRVLFSSPKECWQRPLEELLGVKPYLNCVKMQFSTESFKIFVPDGNLAHRALMRLRFGANSI